jgi:hypothetical protein
VAYDRMKNSPQRSRRPRSGYGFCRPAPVFCKQYEAEKLCRLRGSTNARLARMQLQPPAFEISRDRSIGNARDEARFGYRCSPIRSSARLT